MQLVCHDTGDSRVPWRRLDLKGADFFPLIFCPCKQNHKIIFCLVKVWQPLRTALFEAAVIISLSAEYSQPRWLWWPVHCGTSGQHAQRWIWRHSLLKEPASCIRSLDRELIGFLKPVLGIDWRYGFNQALSVIFLLWYEQIPGKISGFRDLSSLFSLWWAHFQNLESCFKSRDFHLLSSVCCQSVCKVSVHLFWNSWKEEDGENNFMFKLKGSHPFRIYFLHYLLLCWGLLSGYIKLCWNFGNGLQGSMKKWSGVKSICSWWERRRLFLLLVSQTT